VSIKVMSWVWDNGPEKQAERFVLLALADYCNDDGECWPSMAALARKSRVTERGAQKIVRRLVEDGWLEIRAGGGRGNCNSYLVKRAETVNQKRGIRNTVSEKTPNVVAETPNQSALNPERGSPEPIRTIIEPSLKKEGARDALASVIGAELADDLIAHRKALRKPMTARAGELLAKRLAEMRDPSAAVLRSIENGWQGVFEDDRVTPFPNRRQNDGERLDHHLDALKARLAIQRLE
jgi:DNA-binding IscR family transcriptional regulator